jgi:glycosyltransferase involved in cell wall biosynthesis
MVVHNDNIRILYFIGSLQSGGKERRLIELLTYLKNKGGYELKLVLTKEEIHYPAFLQLGIPYQVLNKNWKRGDLSIFSQFYQVCQQFQPNLVHTWGRIQSLYSLPAVIAQQIPLINSQITTAPMTMARLSPFTLLDKLLFHFSAVVLSNSKAGLACFRPPASKSQVIYNGINPQRLCNLPAVSQVKSQYQINTRFAVVMAASFTQYKDYDKFFDLAERVTKIRSDVTFIGVGRYDQDSPFYARMLQLKRNNPRILFPGRIEAVEALVNACDIGILFSTNGEGISNSILEYMALGKPVIADDNRGNSEIVQNQKNGFLVTHQSTAEIASQLISLLDDREKYLAFAAASKKIIAESFALESMGLAFEQVYLSALQARFISLVSADYPVLSRTKAINE